MITVIIGDNLVLWVFHAVGDPVWRSQLSHAPSLSGNQNDRHQSVHMTFNTSRPAFIQSFSTITYFVVTVLGHIFVVYGVYWIKNEARWKCWLWLSETAQFHAKNPPIFTNFSKYFTCPDKTFYWRNRFCSVNHYIMFGFCLVCGVARTLTQNQMERGRKRRTRAKTKTISSHSNTPRFLPFRPAEIHST